MVKAVFFDWMNTLAHPEPDRHEYYCRVARELGLELSPQKVMRGIYLADNQMPDGIPPKWSEEKDPAPFIHFQEIILAEAGVKLPRDMILKLLKKFKQALEGATWVLYDDVLSTLKALKPRGLILGLISNLYIGRARAGLDPYLDVVVTAKEAGAGKPAPPIFRLALERAGVEASQAIYVGDQYDTDVVGARGVGINPILIDRYDLMPEVSDCPRIRTLPEVAQYL
jgi:HAD superfamily hydrolase (TIGR01509 family)